MPIFRSSYLNRKKCFKSGPGIKALVNNLGDIPDDWLRQLTSTICDILKLSPAAQANLQNYFQVHAGANSTYTNKHRLIDTLQTIYLRLSATGKTALNDTQKTMVALKLSEEVRKCTPGFHDRANEIIIALSNQTANIDSFLLKIRHAIVETAATQSTNEVHAHNRFFCVANILGYGVDAIHAKDIHRGDNHSLLDDRIIEERVYLVFKRKYQVFPILNDLVDAIKATLNEKCGYMGLYNAGYKSGDYLKFIACLKSILELEDINPATHLVLNSDCEVVDLNWDTVKQSLFKAMLEKKYFKFAKHEKRCLERLFATNVAIEMTADRQEVIGIGSLFPGLFRQGLIRDTAMLCDLLTHLNKLSVSTQLSLIQRQLNTIYAVDSSIIATIKILTVTKDNKELTKHIKFNHLLPHLLQILPYRHFPCFFDDKPKVLLNLVFYAHEYLNENEITRLLTKKDIQGNNLLMLANRNHPQGISCLLNAMSRIPNPKKRIEIIINCANDCFDVLMQIVNEHPEMIVEMLSITTQQFTFKKQNALYQSILNSMLYRQITTLAQELFLDEIKFVIRMAELAEKAAKFKAFPGSQLKSENACNQYKMLHNELQKKFENYLFSEIPHSASSHRNPDAIRQLIHTCTSSCKNLDRKYKLSERSPRFFPPYLRIRVEPPKNNADSLLAHSCAHNGNSI